MGELLRVASLHAQTAAAEGQGSGVEEHACGADDSSLRSATHELVQCCLRRLEASDTAYMGLSLSLFLSRSVFLSLSVSLSFFLSLSLSLSLSLFLSGAMLSLPPRSF